MSVSIVCPSCGAKFKAPDKAAGRSVKCLMCRSPIVVPAAPGELPFAQPVATASDTSPSDAADAPTVANRATAILTALLITGSALAFILLIAVLVIVLTRTADSPIVAELPNDQLPNAEAKEPSVTPPAPQPMIVEPPPQKNDRAERLAALEEREQVELAALQQKLDQHEPTLRRLRQEEDGLFPKAKKLTPPLIAKFNARLIQFAKDQAAAVRPIAKDALALAVKREDFLQAKRKIMLEQPAAGDPKLEDYGGIILTAAEVSELGQREVNANTPSAGATRYLRSPAAAAIVKGPFFAGAYQDPDEPNLVAFAFQTSSYRGKAELTIPVYVFVHRWRGAWTVLELPGRTVGVLPGAPPATYKRKDSGL